jgi:hypothetical protein
MSDEVIISVIEMIEFFSEKQIENTLTEYEVLLEEQACKAIQSYLKVAEDTFNKHIRRSA